MLWGHINIYFVQNFGIENVPVADLSFDRARCWVVVDIDQFGLIVPDEFG